MSQVDLVIAEYLDRFFIKKATPNLIKRLRRIASEAQQKAEQTYQQLKAPRVVPKEIYIENWVRDEMALFLASKSVKKIPAAQPPSHLKATVDFHLTFPPQLQRKLIKKLFRAQIEKRPLVWQSFDLPVEELEEKFRAVVEERQTFAQKRGFSSYPEFSLWCYQIPKSDFSFFIKKVNLILEFLNRFLPGVNDLPQNFYSPFNISCFLCLGQEFLFSDFSEVIEYLVDKDKRLARASRLFEIEFEKKILALFLTRKPGVSKLSLTKKKIFAIKF